MLWRIMRLRVAEWAKFDSILCGGTVRVAAWLLGLASYGLGARDFGFRLLANIHRTGWPRFCCTTIETLVVRPAIRKINTHGWPAGHFESHVADAADRAPPALAGAPERLLKNLAIVVASAMEPGKKGVIILKYSYVLPLFQRFFEIEQIASRYHLVLEPSWSGYCTEDILCYAGLNNPVFVQAYEPRDSRFLRSTAQDFIPVPLSANWWTDQRAFGEPEENSRDLDFVMVASWADFKRHHRFFAALAKLRRQGHRLSGACIGYPRERTLDDIRRRAEWYGVADQIEFHEWLPQEEVAKFMYRAKANVVWSRREGVNRVIVEGMFCDTPCVLPTGFNYGYPYPYINEQTGCWATDDNLPRVLLDMSRTPWPGSPRKWALEHMTPRIATRILAERIHAESDAHGLLPPSELSVKVNGLHGMSYWDRQDEQRFAPDYAFLRDRIVDSNGTGGTSNGRSINEPTAQLEHDAGSQEIKKN